MKLQEKGRGLLTHAFLSCGFELRVLGYIVPELFNCRELQEHNKRTLFGLKKGHDRVSESVKTLN